MVDGLLLFNGRIHLRADSPETVPSILIDRGRVVRTGHNSLSDEPSRWPAPALDLEGRTVLPGLIDAHLHLEKLAARGGAVDCEVDTLAECLHRVRQRALQSKPGEWILGHGWNQNVWNGYPSAADLDQVIPDRPVYLTAKSLHAAWTNTLGLKMAGIGPGSPDPEGGVIQRSADGTPTGLLFENAVQLVADRIPPPALGEQVDLLAGAQEQLLRFGLTAVHDFDGVRCFQALQALRDAGRLHIRVTKNLPADALDHLIAVGLRSGFGDEWLRLGSVKVFADGALGPRTAAMLAPYEGEPENRGLLLTDQEELSELAIRATEAGLSTSVHAIGDRANHEVLAAFATVRRHEAARGLPNLRHRVEHLQLVHPDDSQIPGRLGLIVSMQPIHAMSDMLAADRYWGPRVSGAYGWKTQLEAGARLAFGSDAPADDPSPFHGLHAAVTRQLPDGRPGPEGWVPSERIRLEQALAAYTTGPAYAAGLEAVQGRLEPGAFADLIVLPHDPYLLAPAELKDLAPVGTMIGGEWRFREF
jgi:hypothetical protein